MKKRKSDATAGARLAPLGMPAVTIEAREDDSPAPIAALAFRLAQQGRKGKNTVLFVTQSERRAEEAVRALQSFAPDDDIRLLPAWDCLPYDRAAPARDTMGRRIAVLRDCLEDPAGRRIIVLSPESLLQKLPPPDAIRSEMFDLAVGQKLDRAAFEQFGRRTGYTVDDRIDEPGEIALRGNVVEVFPADAEEPVRITDDDDGTITTIVTFDPRSQRSLAEIESLQLGPASELISDDENRKPGDEHRMSSHYVGLALISDYLPQVTVITEDGVPDRLSAWRTQVDDAFSAARDFGDGKVIPKPDDLYLSAEQAEALLKGVSELDAEAIEPLPAFAESRNPKRELVTFLREHGADRQIVICGMDGELKQIRSLLGRNTIGVQELLEDIQNLGREQPGVWLSPWDLDAGFIDTAAGLIVIAASDVLGDRVAETGEHTGFTASSELRVGDVVVHEDHGVGILQDLTTIQTEAGEQDTIRLEYHGEATMMVPVADFGRLWRYGAQADAVTLDRLDTDAWDKKRATVSREIDEAAEAIVALAQQRLEATAPVLKAPQAEYRRIAARCPFPETVDQSAAIRAVLEDLTSGHPMNRMICGDVGFGKTEVALRAASVAALCGKQVAIVAPTTVLARQHVESFERRFAGTEITVGSLSRLSSPAELAEAKEKLRSGEMRIVVATQAIVAEDVEIPELGLVIIDEEQRFGAKLKQQLGALGQGVHQLSMSATPIPRSLQAAMVGLQDVSIIATPPSRRRPIRTFVAPFDAATARTALLREARRGGQSFVVVPRVEDIDGVASELARIVPDLQVLIAHGSLKPKEIDTALMSFANGGADILLATNIIESGLDVPRANTMLIWRADRFGLSQLHQLRGRVGRGRAQGIAYLFTDPEGDVAEATRARLSTLEAFDRLGSGFDISARDLELRGAGDLLGEEQAGHVHLIGSALYQQLLENALSQLKGEAETVVEPAELHVGETGSIPVDYVPEPVVRIDLYSRLQRIRTDEQLEAFGEELEDRFGELPPQVETLLALSRIALHAATLGVGRIDAGPLGIALTLRKGAKASAVQKALTGTLKSSEDRLVYERSGGDNIIAELAKLLGMDS
jgi:transcription-repair coupling factor (superfamily II helicase)